MKNTAVFQAVIHSGSCNPFSQNGRRSLFRFLIKTTAVMLALFICMMGLLIYMYKADQHTAVSSSATFLQSFSGTQEIDLGRLESKQLLSVELEIDSGAVEVWIENSNGVRMETCSTKVGYQFDITDDDVYRLMLIGDNATLSVSATVYNPIGK